MLGVTACGIFLTPVFFYLIQRIGDLRGINPAGNGTDQHGEPAQPSPNGHADHHE
jgi:hypothetical protein